MWPSEVTLPLPYHLTTNSSLSKRSLFLELEHLNSSFTYLPIIICQIILVFSGNEVKMG